MRMLENISELFLDRANKEMKERRFQEAIDMILLVVTELEEGVNVVNFVSNLIKELSLSEAKEFLSLLTEEMKRLDLEVLKTQRQHKMLEHFRKKGLLNFHNTILLKNLHALNPFSKLRKFPQIGHSVNIQSLVQHQQNRIGIQSLVQRQQNQLSELILWGTRAVHSSGEAKVEETRSFRKRTGKWESERERRKRRRYVAKRKGKSKPHNLI